MGVQCSGAGEGSVLRRKCNDVEPVMADGFEVGNLVFGLLVRGCGR